MVNVPVCKADAGIDLEVFKQIWQIKRSQQSQLCQQHEAETKVYVMLHYMNKTITVIVGNNNRRSGKIVL